MTDKQIVKTSTIKLHIHLNENNLPVNMEWEADDSGESSKQETKAIILSLFDGEKSEALRIDLWNQEMRVDEMNVFLYQTLATLADTAERSTGNTEAVSLLRETAHQFGHITEIFGPDHHH